MDTEQILCACSAYEQKFYLNPRFSNLPPAVIDELKILSVTYTEDVGGIFTMEFEEDGTLYLSTTAGESDFSYDEIGARLKISQMNREKRELFEMLEKYYKGFFLEEE